MKATLLIITALLGTAAVAQTTAPDPNAPPAATDPNAAPAATDPNAAPATTDMNAAPATTGAGMSDSSTASSSVDTSNYPTCSRSVTDKCVQRGAVRKARRHG
jgi:hypothetical protein